MNKKITDEEKEFSKIIGKRLLYLREHYNLSQTDLGIKLGITQRSISLWEVGKATIPDHLPILG